MICDEGFDAVDACPLRIARHTEPFSLLVAQLAYEGKGGRSCVLVRVVPGAGTTLDRVALVIGGSGSTTPRSLIREITS